MDGVQTDGVRLEDQLCFPLYACAKALARQYRKPLEALGLTYTQYLVMTALWEYGSMTEGALGNKVRLDSGTLTPLLKRLEKQGYIERRRPANNERRLLLRLTAAGDALRHKARAVPDAMKKKIDLPPAELLQLKTLLEKALSTLEVQP